jgi:hypothetical protein
MRQPTESSGRTLASSSEAAARLVAELSSELRHSEDAETAIEVYKMANWIIGQMEEVKQAALNLAEDDMEQRGLERLDTPVGSAGWTEPKARQLDETAWARAMARDPRLREIQRTFEEAESTLERAQEPYRELPESRFYVR